MNTILDYFDHWLALDANRCFSTFLDARGDPQESHTYRTFDLRSRFLAEYLVGELGIQSGDRVLLIYSPGLELIAAFVACVRVGAIPVPLPPPKWLSGGASMTRIQAVVRDCGAEVVLTDLKVLASQRREFVVDDMSTWAHPRVSTLKWIATDPLMGDPRHSGREVRGNLLFLQYTSGSTGTPKGVMVSHENVIHNCLAVTEGQPIGVSWLPHFHDMGLIGYYLFLIVSGGTTYSFSPLDFLRRPVLWLEAISRYRGTFASAPNFGFEYCLSEERIRDDDLTDVDLSSVEVLLNGAEPVRPSTYRNFLARFARLGLRPKAHVVGYGLAENTLAVSCHGRRTVLVDRRSLRQGVVEFVREDTLPAHQFELVSCGRPLRDIAVRIVDPDTGAAVGGEEVGEIWVAGPSKCQGYWSRPDLTDEVFCNRVTNDPRDSNLYLRTGDLGFLDSGELFVCGRLKDVIVLRGRNYQAEDLEAAVEFSSDKVRPGSVVAFQGDNDRLVLVIGLKRVANPPDPVEITHTLRLQDYDGPHTIVLVRHRVIPRTTSGKLARGRAREMWLTGSMRAIETYDRGFDETGAGAGTTVGLRARYLEILREHSLAGHETWTLSEAGLDSLAIVSLLVELDQVADERGASHLSQALDGALLQRFTVSDLSSLVTRIERGDGESIIELHDDLVRLREEQEQDDREAMRRDSHLGTIGLGNLPATTENRFENVLLTGGTGFLGPFLLRSLLDLTDATYYALVRAPNSRAGRERLRDGLSRAGLYSASVAQVFEDRVHVVRGDLGKPGLGLSDREWWSLATTIDSIVHNGARVDYLLAYASLRPENVEGTRELLRLAFTERAKEFHLVSSTIIFGWSARSELFEHDRNAAMESLDFGYAQSKWVSERLALSARERGLAVTLYRPSFLTASTSGFGNPSDVVVRLLAFMVNNGLAPRTLNQISFMPVDIAAHNLAAVIAGGYCDQPALHVTVDDYYNIVDVTRLIARDYGVRFDYVELDRFASEMRRLCTAADPAYPLVDFVARCHPKIAAMQRKRYSNTSFRAVLAQTGRGLPDPSVRKTVSYLMTHMLSAGLINKSWV